MEVSPPAEALSLRHLHHFVGSFPAAAALLGHRLFPDAKEVAESMGALHACRPLLRLVPDPGPQDAIICIGDGFAPRGAALFAAATEGWSCVSCDPGLPAPLEDKRDWHSLDRTVMVPFPVQDVTFRCRRAIVVLVHAHVSLAAALASIRATEIVGVVAVPCCNFGNVQSAIQSCAPGLVYRDPAMLSPKCEVRVWTRPPTAPAPKPAAPTRHSLGCRRGATTWEAAELGEVGGSLAEALRRGADPCMGPAAWESLSAGEAGAALLRSLVCRCPEGAPLDVTLAAPGPEVPAAVALMRVLAEAAPQAAEGRAVRLRVRELGVENPAAGPPHPAHIQLRLGPADEQCSVPGRNDGGADPFRALVDVGALCCIHRRLSSQARRIAFAATAHSLGRAMADEESLAAAVLARSRAAPPAVWTDAAGAALRFDAAYALHHGLVGLVPGPMRRHFEQEALLPACAVPAGEGEVSARDGERSWVRIKPGKAEWTRISGLVRSSMVLSALFPRKGAEERAEPPAPSADEPVPQGASSAHQTLRGGDLRRVARRSVLARAGYGALGGGRLAIPLPRHHWFPRRLASWAATGAGAEGSGDTAYADAALSMAARLERVARQRGEWSTVWDLQRDFPHAPQALGGQVPAGAGAVALCGQVRALCMRRRSVVVVEMRLTPTAHHASTLLELSRGEDRGPGGSEGPRVLVAFTIHCEPKWDGEWDPAVGTEAAGVAGTLPLLKALENGLRGGDLLLVRGAVRPQGKVAAWHPDAIVVAADSIALVGVESPFSPDGETWQLDLTHPCLGHQVATATASA